MWGGSGSEPPFSSEPPLPAPDPDMPLSDGAAYDPAEDRWRLLAEAPRVATNQPIGVWEGHVML
ncbi:MAG: hypothetical protein GEV12_23775, partial [Micromonosporaceae bacterium]|nr:hypothetical protein [Micromonosporaceae bacterium]